MFFIDNALPAGERAACPRDSDGSRDGELIFPNVEDLGLSKKPPGSIITVENLEVPSFCNDQVDGLICPRLGSGYKISFLKDIHQISSEVTDINRDTTDCLDSIISSYLSLLDDNNLPEKFNTIKPYIVENVNYITKFFIDVCDNLQVDAPKVQIFLSSDPHAGAGFHYHKDAIFANFVYGNHGTELMYGDKTSLYRVPKDHIFVWKGDRLVHRNPMISSNNSEPRLVVILKLDLGQRQALLDFPHLD